MDELRRAKVVMPALLAATLLLSVPAFSQQGAAIERGLEAGAGAGVEQVLTQSTDLAGEWTVRNWQSVMERGQGSALGDYLGIPLNDAGRLRAETFDAGEWSLEDLQCRPHPVPYQWRAQGAMRINKEVDPVSRYLEEPFIQSVSYKFEPHTELEYFPCTIVNENISNRIPHKLPGKNPALKEFAEQEGLPYEATRGGAETLYPNYREKMKTMKVTPIKSASRP